MRRLANNLIWLLVLAGVLGIFSLGCRAQPATPPLEYSLPELKYQLISHFGDVFWCDPDLYPIARPDQEKINALEQFPTIKANAAEFSAILKHLNLLDKPQYSDEEKLQTYREYKKLTYAVQITSSRGVYNFSLRVGEGQGERIEGTITSSGEIKVLKREPSINTCPICLAKGTLIDTPDGSIPVEHLRTGMTVWTINSSGKRVSALVVETTMTPVPVFFQVIMVTLSDGRTLKASPNHPTAEGRLLVEYQAGDILDGARVLTLEHVVYDDYATYDLLPSGDTGFYWANSILLKSTMATH